MNISFYCIVLTTPYFIFFPFIQTSAGAKGKNMNCNVITFLYTKSNIYSYAKNNSKLNYLFIYIRLEYFNF